MATIKEIQQRLELVTDLADPFLAEVENDLRSGVQKAFEKRKRAIQAELDEDLRLEHSTGAPVGMAEISVNPSIHEALVRDLSARGWRVVK